MQAAGVDKRRIRDSLLIRKKLHLVGVARCGGFALNNGSFNFQKHVKGRPCRADDEGQKCKENKGADQGFHF